MQQATESSKVLTLPLLPYEYTSTIDLLDNKFVVLTKKKNKNNFEKTNVISIPENTVSPISEILSKNLLPVSSIFYSILIASQTNCTIASNFYLLLKQYIASSFLNNPIINIKDIDRTDAKSTIFVYIPEDITNILTNTKVAYSVFLPLFDYLKNTYFTKDRIEYCSDNIHENIPDGTLLPPIIPIFNSTFYDYLQIFSFTFSFTSSTNKNKECVTTKLNVLGNKFSILSYNKTSTHTKITCITNPNLVDKLGNNTCYIKYNSINHILDKLGDVSVGTSTNSLLEVATSDTFFTKDPIEVSKILKQDIYDSILPKHIRTISTKKINLLVDLETVSIELPKVITTISNTTTFNRLLNTVVLADTDVNSQIRCKSFSKLTSSEKYNSILRRFNTLYVHCYDSIKANLDKIGLTSIVLKRNNKVNQSYPLVESTKVNRQESFFINNINNKRDLFQDIIKNLGIPLPDSLPSSTKILDEKDEKNYIDFEKTFYPPTGRKLFGDDMLLNNSFAIFQKYITNILPPLNFTCVHKDSDYQSLATKIITLKMYEFYIYSNTALNPLCFNQHNLKLVNSPNFPKISPITDSYIHPVRHTLDTIDEEFVLHCYFFYIPRTIALEIASKVSLDMINSYNFLPTSVNNSIPSTTVDTAASTTNATVTTPTTSADDITKELNNNNESIINGMGEFCTDTIKDLASIIDNYSKKLSLDNKGSNDISNKQ
jgi:hypothetical protein